jgi:hypothetical protein
MSQPKEPISESQQGQLINYLLGLLPEEEAERLDEASIMDDDVAGRLCSVENDLIDAYVMETLDQDTRGHFESCYLTSPRRREKVRFARRFLTAVDRASVPPVAPLAVAPSRLERVRPFPAKPDAGKRIAVGSRYNWPLLTTAASVVLACGVLVNDLQLRQGLNRARRLGADNDRRAEMLTEQLDQARNENIEIADALERARAAAARERPAVSAPPAASSSPLMTSRAKATVLFPQTRSIGQIPKIEVAGGADSVPFELRLESDEYAQYQAVLKDPDTDRIVWRSGVVRARTASPAVVSLIVPANLLEPRHYAFELAGIDRAGHQTTTATYALQIDRR